MVNRWTFSEGEFSWFSGIFGPQKWPFLDVFLGFFRGFNTTLKTRFYKIATHTIQHKNKNTTQHRKHTKHTNTKCNLHKRQHNITHAKIKINVAIKFITTHVIKNFITTWFYKNKNTHTNVEKTKIDFWKMIKKGFHCTVEYTILWHLIKKIYVLKNLNTKKIFIRSHKNKKPNRMYCDWRRRNRTPKNPHTP